MMLVVALAVGLSLTPGPPTWSPTAFQRRVRPVYAAADSEATRDGNRALRRLAANDDDTFTMDENGKKYVTYDAIRAQLAASRSRSYEQGRKGCCGKASDYLGQGSSQGPPPGSPWARDARAADTAVQ